MEKEIKLLVTAYDYRPCLGGVASCAFETTLALSKIPNIKIRLLTRRYPDIDMEEQLAHDSNQCFVTKRNNLSSNTLAAAFQMSNKINQELLTWRPHGIINFLWLPSALASFISPVRVFTNTPYFTFAHGVEVMETSRNIRKQIRKSLSPIKKATFNNAAAIFAVSNYTKELVETNCEVPSEKIKVIYNGVNTEEFYPSAPSQDLIEKYELKGKRVFLTMSRLEEYKGVDRVISALRFILDRHPDVVYMVCGEGKDLNRLKRLAQHYRVQNNVIFTGSIPFGRRKDFYNLCECFILIPRLDLEKPEVEGFGLVFLEAAACEKPSIGSLSGGIPDSIQNGKTGWLVDPEKIENIAQVWLECLDFPERTLEFGKRARSRVLQTLTWEILAQRIYGEVIKHVRN